MCCGNALRRVKMPGSTFVVVADPALLPTVLGRPGLPKSRVYELGFFVRPPLLFVSFWPVHNRLHTGTCSLMSEL